MTDAMIRTYSSLVHFLGEALGPCYEVVLQDTSGEKGGIVAIANGEISGRHVGSPLTGSAIRMIMSRKYEETDMVLNYRGVLKDGRTIRSSTKFLYDENGKLAGLLCINFDPTPFRNMARTLTETIHPNDFIRHYLEPAMTENAPSRELAPIAGPTEYFSADSTSLMNDLFTETTASTGLPTSRLKQEEKILLITKLYESGLFKLKGSVEFAAEKLDCSQASIYRYLTIVKKNENKARPTP